VISIFQRGSITLAAFTCALASFGCTSTATRFLGEDIKASSEVSGAIGAFHEEIAGLHLIGTFTLFKDGTAPSDGPAVDLASFQSHGWSIDFQSPEPSAKDAARWIRDSQSSLRSGFERLVEFARAAYPNAHGRNFRILVLPPGSNFDRSWEYITMSDRNLRMTFALTLPGTDRQSKEGGSKSMLDLYPVLGHEFSHSYFWFHKDRYRNNFSDEVVAYTTERCLAWELLGRSPSVELAAPKELRAAADRDEPAEVYRRFHYRYSDSQIASVVAPRLLSRTESGNHEGTDALARYCRTIPTAGVDFAKGPPSSRSW